MSNQENGLVAFILLVLTLPLLLALAFKRTPREDIESRQAKSYASGVLKANKKVFERLAEM